MKKITVSLLAVTLCICSSHAFAQSMEQLLFDNLCKEISFQNSNYLIKKKLDNQAVIVEDPITGEQDIYYNSNTGYVVDFKKKSKEEQYKILETIELPAFPLKDTIYFNDSLKIFSLDLISKINGKTFIHKGSIEYKPTYSLIGIKSLLIRINSFILACSFPNNTFVSTYNFIYQNEKFSTSNLSFYNTDDPHVRKQ